MGSLTNKKMLSRAQQRLQQLDEVEADVLEELFKIKEHIERVQAKINANLNTPNNLNGCLRGDCDEFV